jgi:hypothetical protein
MRRQPSADGAGNAGRAETPAQINPSSEAGGESVMNADMRPAYDCDAAQVVAIGESRFGILWNGRLRAEEYPTQRFALLAIAALRCASVDGTPGLPRSSTGGRALGPAMSG